MKTPAILATVALTFAMAGCSSAAAPVADPEISVVPDLCRIYQVDAVEEGYKNSPDGVSMDVFVNAIVVLFAMEQEPSIDQERSTSQSLTWFLDKYGDCLSVDAYLWIDGWRENALANGK